MHWYSCMWFIAMTYTYDLTFFSFDSYVYTIKTIHIAHILPHYIIYTYNVNEVRTQLFN